MAVVSRATFASSLATKVNNNTAGEISAQDMREVITDLEDSAAWNDEVVPRASSVNLAAGYTTTSHSLGTGSGTVTPAFANGNQQKLTNAGAFTLAAPSSGEGSMQIYLTNASGAGVITLSGFISITGAPLTTSNGHKFILSIGRDGSDVWLNILASSGNV
jgi:hypothetical protein